MGFELLGENLTPAEGECSVRTYRCTSLSSRLLSLKADGYLAVTNKRLVFYAHGSSYAGKSVLQSEVPIADVSGISCYKGTYFSLTHLLTAILASFIVGSLISGFTSAVVFLVVNRFPTIGILSVLFWIVPLPFGIVSLLFPWEKIIRSILATSSAMLFLAAGGASASGILGSLAALQLSRGNNLTTAFAFALTAFGFLLASGVGIYGWVCYFLYARRKTMSLAVGSKGGSSTPIAISGISGFGLYNTAAMRALTAEPAPDAESMIKELGAMVTDIQTLGDHGVQKWSRPQLAASPVAE